MRRRASEIIENFILTVYKNAEYNIKLNDCAFHQFPYRLEVGQFSRLKWYTDKKYILILYGEVTNLKELAQSNCITVDSEFDVIILLFEKYGVSFFDRLNGRCACILIDRFKHCVYICRDYIGSKALYYFESNNAFYITSHARNLYNFSSVNRHYISKLLNDERIYGTETIFNNVRAIPNGSIMLLINEKTTYFYKRKFDIPQIRYNNKSDYYEHFRELIQKSLKKYSESNVAFTISGGLDCTLLAYLFTHMTQKQIQAYTFDLSPYGKSSEEFYISEIKNNPRINVKYVNLNNNFLENIINERYDEPNHYILTNAWSLMLKECKLAAVPSLVTGFGGDEITIGRRTEGANYVKNKEGADMSVINTDDYTSRSYLYGKYNERINYYGAAASKNINKSYFAIYNRIFSGEIGRLVYRYEQDCFEQLGVNFILPFLEREIIDFSLGIPVDVHSTMNVTKKLQRKAGHNLMPKCIEERMGKSDFFNWYIIELLRRRNLVEELISSSIVLSDGYGASNIAEIARNFYQIHNMSFVYKKEYAVELLNFIAVELWLRGLKNGD